jgi:hypothetical protein
VSKTQPEIYICKGNGTEREATNRYVDASYCSAIVGGKNASGVNGFGRASTVLFEVMQARWCTQESASEREL